MDELNSRKQETSELAKQIENYRSKIVRYQEDKDQLEQYQLQEMSKIKHLVSCDTFFYKGYLVH